jgi:hypothetical protein
MLRRLLLSLTLFVVAAQAMSLAQTPAPAAPVPDVTGRWTASFDTQVGVQEYTYDFVAKGGVLTGTMASNMGGKSDVRDGKIDGSTVTFKETLTFMEMAIDISYTGQIVSADEIRFSRAVGEFATEELVAKRAK